LGVPRREAPRTRATSRGVAPQGDHRERRTFDRLAYSSTIPASRSKAIKPPSIAVMIAFRVSSVPVPVRSAFRSRHTNRKRAAIQFPVDGTDLHEWTE
jgi:hypothetical protein